MRSRLYTKMYDGESIDLFKLVGAARDCNPIAAVDKICGKNEYSKGLLQKMLMNATFSGNASLMLGTIDCLGLYGNRLALLHHALGSPDYSTFAMMLDHLLAENKKNVETLQDEVIACKTEDDFKAFVEKYNMAAY